MREWNQSRHEVNCYCTLCKLLWTESSRDNRVGNFFITPRVLNRPYQSLPRSKCYKAGLDTPPCHHKKELRETGWCCVIWKVSMQELGRPEVRSSLC